MLFRSDGMLVLVSIPPIRPPYPRWYNENASCEYHSGNRGHYLEYCTALKWRVSEFIKKEELTFEDEDIPNVNENPLPNHGGPKVNAVKNNQDLQVKRDVKDVRMPIKLVYEALIKVCRLKDVRMSFERCSKRGRGGNESREHLLSISW